ncbi:MAG: peptide-methionine (R)-S-oxide reductase MsrB [Gammaproteobacteria bacterium]
MSVKRIEKSDAEWRAELSPEQYAICREKATERAFTGKYYDCKDPGIYRCACCDVQLFSSETKYDSGSGWPSFYAPLSRERLRTIEDNKFGMQRVEVLCAACDAHLGHVFPDGPEPTGLRFCINSTALKLDRNAHGHTGKAN